MSGETRELVWIPIVVAFLAAIIAVLLWSPINGYMMGDMMMLSGGYMFLIPIAFLVFVGIGAYYFIMELTRTTEFPRNQSISGIKILEERYTKGEIIRDQYYEMRKEIES